MNVMVSVGYIVTAIVSHWIFQSLFFIGIMLYAANKNKEEVKKFYKETKDGAIRMFKAIRKE